MFEQLTEKIQKVFKNLRGQGKLSEENIQLALSEVRLALLDADVDLEVASDPMLPEVGWAWLMEAMEEAESHATAIGGTVTQVNSRSFGVMDERAPEGRLQVRASWTATTFDLVPHARVWALLTSAACGLAPSSEGVSNLNRTRQPR